MGGEIRPFKIHVNDADDLEDLKKRLRATRWPEPQTVPDWSQWSIARRFPCGLPRAARLWFFG